MEQNNEMQNFEQRLKQLVAKARSNKDVLEVDTINDFFKEMNLEVNQIDKIYEYLDAHGILVMSPMPGEDMPDDDELPLVNGKVMYFMDYGKNRQKR